MLETFDTFCNSFIWLWWYMMILICLFLVLKSGLNMLCTLSFFFMLTFLQFNWRSPVSLSEAQQQKVFEELDEIVGSLTCSGGPHAFSCFQCNYTTAVKTNLTGHIEANHLAGYNIRIPCKYVGCGYISSTRNANRKHISKKH